MATHSVGSRNEMLTDRERDILSLLSAGLSDREIAEKRVLTLGTVKWYNHQIYAKLGVGSRTQALNQARELGLLEHEFLAPPSTVQPSRSHLPAETTRFIGRVHEIAQVKALLRTTRLLTLTGSPGTGKTRLSLRVCAEVQADFADGAWFVDLAPLRDPAHVAMSIADALEIEERASENLVDTLKKVLRDRHLLLVLDNFEHLLAAMNLVSDLLVSAPRLKVLVTSREVLHLYGEQEYVVPPMQLPDAGDPATLALNEAVALFVQQARAVKPDLLLTTDNWIDIARICIRLDGLPLAIELAAAHSKLLSPDALLKRLERPFETLTKGSRNLPARQQTLRQTIDWSFNLLSPGEQTLFARLGIFSSGWTLEAMQDVCGAVLSLDPFDGLGSLIDKSLVRQQDTMGTPRFTMLETLHEYALEQLSASGEMDVLRARHARYYTELAERIEQGMRGMAERSTLDNLELEHDNFRAVLAWSLTSDSEPGLRLIAALGQCWRMRGHLLEGWRWSQELLAMGGHIDPMVHGGALASASMLAFHLGHHQQSEQMSRDALALAHADTDSPILAWASFAVALARIRPQMTAEDYGEAERRLDNALSIFRSLNHTLGIAKCMTVRGELARLQGAREQAAVSYQEALALMSELGNMSGVLTNLANLGWTAQHLGDDDRAEKYFRESYGLAQQLHDRAGMINAIAGLAALAVKTNEWERAARMFGTIEAEQRTYGNVLCATDLADYEPFVSAARTRLEKPVFDLRWQEGGRLSIEQVIRDVSNHSLT